MLSVSGYIAGIINPPAAGKYGYWTNDKTPTDPDAWLEKAKETKGSWWPDWDAWVAGQGGKAMVAARKPGAGKLKDLADAPGTYVKIRVS